MKNILDNKVVNFIASFVEWVVCILLILLIALIAFQKFSNQGNFFGYRIYTIATGSMIPTYNIGDTVLIKEMDASNIKVGDAVTYLGESPGVDGMIITHEVVEVATDEDGKYYFHTKGVANNIEDPIVYEDQVLGKVVYRFYFLSILGKITTNMALLLIFIIFPIALFIGIEMAKLIYKKDEEDEDVEASSNDDKVDSREDENEIKEEDTQEENEIEEKKITEKVEDESLKEDEKDDNDDSLVLEKNEENKVQENVKNDNFLNNKNKYNNYKKYYKNGKYNKYVNNNRRNYRNRKNK